MGPYERAQLQMIITTLAAELVSNLTGEAHAIDNVKILANGAVCVTTTTKGESVMAVHPPGGWLDDDEDATGNPPATIEPPAAVVPLFLHTTVFFIPEAVTVMAVKSLIGQERQYDPGGLLNSHNAPSWKKHWMTAFYKQPIFERERQGRPTPRFYTAPSPGLTRTFPVQPVNALHDKITKFVVVSDGSHPAWAVDALHQFLPIPVLVINNDTKTFDLTKPSGQHT